MNKNPQNPDSWHNANYSDSVGRHSPRNPSASSSYPISSNPLYSPDGLTPTRGAGEERSRQKKTSSSREKLGNKLLRSLPRSWQFWAILTVILSGTLGFSAVALLLKQPAGPNCATIFWPTASASLRLYCAQAAAEKQTAEGLLKAIALVEGLPSDHPLRSEIDQSLQEWSEDLLKIGDRLFQEGKLKEAIAIARKIPARSAASKLVEQRIQRWQSIWSDGEKIYQKAEEQLRASNWMQAFAEAIKLTNLSNKYWATTKYDELAQKINLAKEESARLDQAHRSFRRGGVKNLLTAIKLAAEIEPKSYAYKEAQDLLKKCLDQILQIAQQRLDSGDWQSVLEIAKEIPKTVNLQGQIQEITDLARAFSYADKGTVAALEDAISLAQKLPSGSSLYSKSQQLIVRWQREIEDVAHIQRARELATSGTVPDLRAAIAEAQKIPISNPRYSQAVSEITQWTRQIETIEDQPLLNRANQLATLETIAALQDAISEASSIRSGRVLYPEAQNKIRQWNEKIQRMQDQPVLDQAQAQANVGNLNGAIAVAQSIRSGRVLYSEAQSRIRQWNERIQRVQDQPYLDQAQAQANFGNLNGAINVAQSIKPGRVLYQEAQKKIQDWNREIERQQDQPFLDQAEALAIAGDLNNAIAAAQQISPGRALYRESQAKIRTWNQEMQAERNLQSAYQLASRGTVDAFTAAIRAARLVPRSSRLRAEARQVINNWSDRLYAIAQERSASDLAGAIAIARSIPSGTNAYQSAQLQVRTWRNILNPPPAPSPSPVAAF